MSPLLLLEMLLGAVLAVRVRVLHMVLCSPRTVLARARRCPCSAGQAGALSAAPAMTSRRDLGAASAPSRRHLGARLPRGKCAVERTAERVAESCDRLLAEPMGSTIGSKMGASLPKRPGANRSVAERYAERYDERYAEIAPLHVGTEPLARRITRRIARRITRRFTRRLRSILARRSLPPPLPRRDARRQQYRHQNVERRPFGHRRLLGAHLIKIAETRRGGASRGGRSRRDRRRDHHVAPTVHVASTAPLRSRRLCASESSTSVRSANGTRPCARTRLMCGGRAFLCSTWWIRGSTGRATYFIITSLCK